MVVERNSDLYLRVLLLLQRKKKKKKKNKKHGHPMPKMKIPRAMHLQVLCRPFSPPPPRAG